MELTPENKRNLYIIGAIILILFVVGMMLKFWMYIIAPVACFGFGYYYGRRSTKPKNEGKKGFF